MQLPPAPQTQSYRRLAAFNNSLRAQVDTSSVPAALSNSARSSAVRRIFSSRSMRSPGGSGGRPAFRLGVAFIPLIVALKNPLSTPPAQLTGIIIGATIIGVVGRITQQKTPPQPASRDGAETTRLVAELHLQAPF